VSAGVIAKGGGSLGVVSGPLACGFLVFWDPPLHPTVAQPACSDVLSAHAPNRTWVCRRWYDPTQPPPKQGEDAAEGAAAAANASTKPVLLLTRAEM
jgi:hypothetical protein